MASYGADDELAGGEAGAGLGAQVPPPDDAGDILNPVPPAQHRAAVVADVDYPFDFVTEYVGDRGGGADEVFGLLLGSGVAEESPAEPVVPLPIDDLGDEAAMVRPYAWTRGRTKANYDLKLETLISTTDLGQDETLLPQLEHRAVSSLCRYPLSVAEVAAKLSIPLGVARVILSDMAELGLISIHRTFADDDIAAHLVLMERVLSGLRRL
ncbi:MAG TPA: DUF742 domain-containing protein [Pseudonocardiaceae bacterium]|nr:DUF742 domain-containing protein [Pseudonocardiaceae bacterium]